MVKVKNSETKRPKRKREDILLQENLPKDWFWVWWPDSGWWKVRITDIEEEEDWYWPRTQEPLDSPILSLTISYDSDKAGSTCFIERVLWHEGVLYDQEGEEKISYCLNRPEENVANDSEIPPSEDSFKDKSPSSPSAGSSETGSRSREKVFRERNKEKVQTNTRATKVGTSPRKDSLMQEKVAENTREKAKNVLKQTLLENLEDTGEYIDRVSIEKIAFDIENALYAKYFKADYLAQLRSVTFNLRGKRNLDLKRAIVVSEISPARLAEMTADELASKSMREERKRREQESFARAVIRDPTDVGIVKGMNSTEILQQRPENSYESDQVFPKDSSLQEAFRQNEDAENGESKVQGSSSGNGETINEVYNIQTDLQANDSLQQKNSMEAQQSSSLTLSNLELCMSNGLDDKFQQFASSMGESDSDRPSKSILRGSTTDAIRSKRRTPVWQGKISFDESISFNAVAFYLVGPNNYAVLPEEMNVIGRTELSSTIEFVKGLEHSTSREFSVVYFKPRDSRDEKNFKEFIGFLSKRKRAGVLFQTGQSEAYILPPAKLTGHIHDYGHERVLGVVVTRKLFLKESPISLSKQVNMMPTERASQGSHLWSQDEEDKSISLLDSSHSQLPPEASKEVVVADPEKGKEGSFDMFSKSISTNISSASEKAVLSSHITEEQHRILPGLPKGPQLSSVIGFRSLPGIPGLNKTNESDKEPLQK
ncbi:hypothetical protein GpartN1_g2504.t1 [Galdieria partita]|uniref:TFIIS central domain-containing protein n=1 Tax=Galdieria partita TaxID=83374 RepID=A0A9C7PTW1_9RHOD|nr:hypothetical protein GpartN1_g2504.t1 [Galdieria partita]